MKVYLDYAATTPLLPEARAAMIEVMDGLGSGEMGNASALHSPGQNSKAILDEVRAEVARLINADPEEIIFTSGGSEANNLVAETFRGQKIVTSAIEHPSVLDSMRARAGKFTQIPVDRYGHICPDEIADELGDADLVSVMLANNELGTLEPVAELVKRCKNYNTTVDAKNGDFSTKNTSTNAKNSEISAENASAADKNTEKCCKIYNTSPPKRPFIHSDATQALGKVEIDVKALGVDYLTVSAHKIGGPVGIGALYVRKGAPLRPLIIGGHQEKKRRAGTSNVLLAAGFGAAAKWCQENQSYKKYAKVHALRDRLAERVLREVPYSSLNSSLEDNLPNILNVSFAAAEGESIQLYLDAAGVTISTGSACASGDLQPSHVLMATRGNAEVAHSSVRFSLGLDTTVEEIDYVMSVLPAIISRLQGISTIKIQEPYAK